MDAVAYHDTLAEGWDARYQKGGFRRRAQFFQRRVLPRMEVRGHWLDVGCGSGYFSRLLAREGASVSGIDGSATMIAAARSMAPPDAPLDFEVKPIASLDYRPGAFNGVICLSVIEYLEDPEACLKVLATATRPDGQLVISAPNRRSAVRYAQRLVRATKGRGPSAFGYLETSRHSWSADELRAMATRAGWSCEAILGFDPLLPRFLHFILAPSLLFMVARQQGGGRAASA